MVGRRQSGGPAADHGDALAALVQRLGETDAGRERPVANEMFDRVDPDMSIDLIAIACVLAWRGADSSHHRRKRVRFGHAAEGVFLPAHAVGRLVEALNDA